MIFFALATFLIGPYISQPLWGTLSLASYINCIYKAYDKNLMSGIDIPRATQGQAVTKTEQWTLSSSI